MAYRGIPAVIPRGQGSLNSSQNRLLIPPTDLLLAEGIVYEDRVERKEPGKAVFAASPISGNPTILAACDWWATDSTQRLISACSDGKIYKEVGGVLDSVTLASGLSTTAKGIFVPGGAEAQGNSRKLFYVNGVNAMQVLAADGAAMAAVSDPPADWAGAVQPFTACPHNNRIAAAGLLNNHQVYLSGFTNHEAYNSEESSFINCYPGVGLRIAALIDVRPALLVFKHPQGIYYLDDSDLRDQYWRFQPVTEDVGIANSQYAALKIAGGDVLFLTNAGTFHLLSALGSNPSDVSVRRSNLSDAMALTDWLQSNLNLTRLDQVVSWWFDSKSLAVFALPGVGSTTNNLRLFFDFTRFQSEAKVQFSYSTRDTQPSLFGRKGTDGVPRPCFGDTTGNIWQLDQETRSAGTSRIRFGTDFSYLDGRNGFLEKLVQFLGFDFTPKGTCTLSVALYLDGTLKRTMTVNANQRTDTRRTKCGRGVYLEVDISHSAAEDFSIGAARIYFTQASQRKG